MGEVHSGKTQRPLDFFEQFTGLVAIGVSRIVRAQIPEQTIGGIVVFKNAANDASVQTNRFNGGA